MACNLGVGLNEMESDIDLGGSNAALRVQVPKVQA